MFTTQSRTRPYCTNKPQLLRSSCRISEMNSFERPAIQDVLGETYVMLQDVNKKIRRVQVRIFHASFQWKLLQGSSDISDPPEYWADPIDDTWIFEGGIEKMGIRGLQ
ncbi:unnamed protein product [Clonostachys rosea f. rosea IK726]|uniref:Uncharacterized protein n=1 Tax=Clonostachys rosea f. rosea IK726 TaxID=1349383 RepID=A0ACA9TCE9_BIOOC|nr:unnamed protein product [Clonostachys rosea f. rosea IK726]